MRLTLVGTGHVFRIGEIVAEIIRRRGPHVVCVELDPVRLAGLRDRARLAAYEEAGDPRAEEMHRQHDEATRRMPRLYRFLARLQDRLADQEGVEAGSEMLAAVEAAEGVGAPVATIDVDAQQLIRRAWGEMTWRERMRFLWAIMRGRKGTQVEAELADYQDDPVAYLARVGEEFPNLKRVLIDERDEHMAKRILHLKEIGVAGVRKRADQQQDGGGASQVDPRLDGGGDKGEETGDRKTEEDEELVVVAVVGDGHIPGILPILEKTLPDEHIETIRVGDLRSGTLPEAKSVAKQTQEEGDGKSVTLRYEVPHVEQPEREPPGV